MSYKVPAEVRSAFVGAIAALSPLARSILGDQRRVRRRLRAQSDKLKLTGWQKFVLYCRRRVLLEERFTFQGIIQLYLFVCPTCKRLDEGYPSGYEDTLHCSHCAEDEFDLVLGADMLFSPCPELDALLRSRHPSAQKLLPPPHS